MIILKVLNQRYWHEIVQYLLSQPFDRSFPVTHDLL